MAGRSDGSVEGTTKFDIGLTMRDLDGAMMGCIEYAVARFTQAAIRRMGERFIILLQSVVANPHETVGKLRIISEQERQKIIGDWSRQ
jgi:non-ribosomal peptide synthetase component F